MSYVVNEVQDGVQMEITLPKVEKVFVPKVNNLANKVGLEAKFKAISWAVNDSESGGINYYHKYDIIVFRPVKKMKKVGLLRKRLIEIIEEQKIIHITHIYDRWNIFLHLSEESYLDLAKQIAQLWKEYTRGKGFITIHREIEE